MRTRTTAATTGTAGQRREERGSDREKGADVRQDVREAGEDREGQGVLTPQAVEEEEREERHQHGGERLAADVRADDRLEVDQDPREPDVVERGTTAKSPPRRRSRSIMT